MVTKSAKLPTGTSASGHKATLPGGVLVALMLLVCSGAGYRLAAARLAPSTGGISLPPGTLNRLPLEIGDWFGRELKMSAAVIEATDTDDRVSRAYTSGIGLGSISLFVGYGVRLRDLAPHRPEVCYSGSGWTLDSTDRMSLEMSDGVTVTCQFHRFHRGGLGTQRMTVLNYYIVDGRYCPDVSLLRSKAWRFTTDSSYVAQVQVACSSDSDESGCEKAVRAFAAESAPAIQKCLTEGIEEARSN